MKRKLKEEEVRKFLYPPQSREEKRNEKIKKKVAEALKTGDPARLKKLLKGESPRVGKAARAIRQEYPSALAEIEDLDRLMYIWHRTPSFDFYGELKGKYKLKGMVEEHVFKVCSEVGLSGSKMERLEKFWHDFSEAHQDSSSTTNYFYESCQVIEDRMVGIIRNVDPKNPPSWLVKIIKRKKSVPDYYKGKVKEVIGEKAREILGTLSSLK